MVVSTAVKMDLMNKSTFGAPPKIKVVQNDIYSRNIVFTLFDGGKEWNVPNEAETVVRFVRRDGTGGNYSQMPNGENACTYTANELTVGLAPSVTIAPGPVQVGVGIIADGKEINTFSVMVDVEPNPGLEATSEGYYKVIGSLADSGWTPNKYLGTDANGNVVTKDAPGGSGGGSTDEGTGSGLTEEQAAALERISIDGDGYTKISGQRQMTNFTVTETDTTITLDITMEGGVAHTHVLNFDANGYPTSITVDGVDIPGDWKVENG